MDPKVVEFRTEGESGRFKWAIRALANEMDTRPVLECLMKVGKRLICADGFRAHSIPVIKDMEELPDGAYRLVNKPRKHDEAVTIVAEENFKVQTLQTLVGQAENQVAAIAIQAGLLRKSLKGDLGDRFVVLRIYNVPGETDTRRRYLTIESVDGECVAIIMSGMVGDMSPQTRRLVAEPEPPKEEVIRQTEE